MRAESVPSVPRPTHRVRAPPALRSRDASDPCQPRRVPLEHAVGSERLETQRLRRGPEGRAASGAQSAPSGSSTPDRSGSAHRPRTPAAGPRARPRRPPPHVEPPRRRSPRRARAAPWPPCRRRSSRPAPCRRPARARAPARRATHPTRRARRPRWRARPPASRAARRCRRRAAPATPTRTAPLPPVDGRRTVRGRELADRHAATQLVEPAAPVERRAAARSASSP